MDFHCYKGCSTRQHPTHNPNATGYAPPPQQNGMVFNAGYYTDSPCDQSPMDKP